MTALPNPHDRFFKELFLPLPMCDLAKIEISKGEPRLRAGLSSLK